MAGICRDVLALESVRRRIGEVYPHRAAFPCVSDFSQYHRTRLTVPVELEVVNYVTGGRVLR